jgi:hypothetical protein
MKNPFYLILAALVISGISSCKKDPGAELVTKSESLSLGAGYANDIYYRFSDGLVTSVPRSNWDIGFSVSPREAAILTNGAAGVTLKAYPASSWTWDSAIDTTGYHNWTDLYNSDTTWTEGAFNMNETGYPNYGWGNYDIVSHNLTGVTLYIIKTRSGSFKKIWIEEKLSVDQQYKFRYSDLNGENEKDITLSLAGKTNNFVYYSIDTDSEVDREPDKTTWDIVFTKYIDNSINYPVTGVLQNIGVTAQESTDTDPTSKAMPEAGYLTDISTIGSDWKIIDMTTYLYSIDDSRVFFVKDMDNNIFRLRFTTFEGSATGNLSFDVTTLK